jgi:transposase-like protein
MTREGRRNDDEAMLYTETFKARMVRQMLGPKAVSAHALSGEAGVSQPTLSRWLRETSTFRAVAKKDQNKAPPAETAAAGKRPQDWTAGEQLRAVADILFDVRFTECTNGPTHPGGLSSGWSTGRRS